MGYSILQNGVCLVQLAAGRVLGALMHMLMRHSPSMTFFIEICCRQSGRPQHCYFVWLGQQFKLTYLSPIHFPVPLPLTNTMYAQ